jgi:hypothetical protein
MSIQCAQLRLVLIHNAINISNFLIYMMLLRHLYIVAARGVTSALVISHFERERAQRFTKQAYRCNQWLKTYQKR